MKKSQPRLPARRPAPRPRPSVQAQPAHSQEQVDTLIGLTDPFSSLAANARYPDAGASKTLTFQQRNLVALSVDGEGESSYAFNPKANFIGLVGSNVGTTATWAASWTVDNTANLLNTYGATYRPTSAGMRVVSTLSATDSSGYFVIASGGVPIRSGTTVFSPSNFTSWDIHPIRNGGEWHATSKPRSTESYDTWPISTYNAATSAADDSWETIFIYIVGTKVSSSPLIVEMFVNYEYTPLDDSPIAQMAVPQPILNVQMQTAVNQVHSSLPTSHKTGQKAVSDFIKREGKKALLKHVLPFAAKRATALLL